MELEMDATTDRTSLRFDVVVLGAGYAGLMSALRLQRGKPRLSVALVGHARDFLERVRLQERIVAEVTPRIPSVADFVSGTGIQFILGTVTVIDPVRGVVRIKMGAEERDLAFDQAICALGSSIDTTSVPGAADHAYRLEAGSGPRSAAALRARLEASAGDPLRIIVVGGAETAVEVAGEIKTAWPLAQITMISRSRCGDFRGERVEAAVRAALVRLKVRLVDDETVTEVHANDVTTSSGAVYGCDICVWSGGLRAPSLAQEAGLATNRQGRILVDGNLRSLFHPHILAVGDAACPVAPTGAPYRMSAFAALVTGAHAADVILAQRANGRLRPFSFSTFGQGVAIGRGGVGFFSYPDDRQRLFIVHGRAARAIRNLFVWLLIALLIAERRFPGFFLWPGRRRVSWQQANAAIKQAIAPSKASA
jgi:NADH:ubiquinone reductase (H+-translocating)